MKKEIGALLGIGLILGFGAAGVRAEEAAPAGSNADVLSPEEELEYTFGTVKSVGADQVVITEFDYDTGEEKDVTYVIDPKVELNNVASLKEIAQGDEVDIDYRVEDQKNVAKVISVAKPLPGEADSGE